MKISEKVKALFFVGVLTVAGIGVLALPSGEAFAGTALDEAKNGMNATNLGVEDFNVQKAASNLVNILLYIIGILAVVMIIFGGIMYTTSAGDQAKVTKAKNIILYGIVGLVIAILSYAIVNFVITKLFPDSTSGGDDDDDARGGVVVYELKETDQEVQRLHSLDINW